MPRPAPRGRQVWGQQRVAPEPACLPVPAVQRQVDAWRLAQLKAALGSLSRIERIVKLGAFVCSTPDFTEQPKVANGASDLMKAVFGDIGQHARAAVGVASLPLGCPVEVEAIFALK